MKAIVRDDIKKGDRYFNTELYYYDNLKRMLEEVTNYLPEKYDSDWVDSVLEQAFPSIYEDEC